MKVLVKHQYLLKRTHDARRVELPGKYSPHSLYANDQTSIAITRRRMLCRYSLLSGSSFSGRNISAPEHMRNSGTPAAHRLRQAADTSNCHAPAVQYTVRYCAETWIITTENIAISFMRSIPIDLFLS